MARAKTLSKSQGVETRSRRSAPCSGPSPGLRQLGSFSSRFRLRCRSMAAAALSVSVSVSVNSAAVELIWPGIVVLSRWIISSTDADMAQHGTSAGVGACKCAWALALPQQGGHPIIGPPGRSGERRHRVGVSRQLKPLVTLSNHARMPTGPMERAATRGRRHRVSTPPTPCWFRADSEGRNHGKPQGLGRVRRVKWQDSPVCPGVRSGCLWARGAFEQMDGGSIQQTHMGHTERADRLPWKGIAQSRSLK